MTTIRFRCAEPGASTFADLVAPERDSRDAQRAGRWTRPRSSTAPGSRWTGWRTENELVVDAQCAYSRTGEGMHRFVDPEDGEVYLYTQYEPADARRVFANFEQPDLKAPFTLQVTAPEGWTVLSNGAPEAGPGDGDGGVARSPETQPISTYITAVVAGPVPLRDRHLPPHLRGRHDAGDPARRAVPQGAGQALRRGRHLHSSPSRAWTSSTTTSTTRTPSGSTTRRSCPSTTSARWRTRAA